MKVERVSYEVMTPSAARGVLEAVLWKPQIAWCIHSIAILSPVQWTSFRRNEIQSRASPRSAEILADEDRTQRNTVALRDADYAVEASFELTPQAGAGDSIAKYVAMFRRRLEKGQHHHAPYLGCREFAAAVELARSVPEPIEAGVRRPLGLMFYDFDWPGFTGGETPDERPPRALFFNARLEDGVMRVPSREQVRAENGVNT
jgi:CRISPR-associated protein Cas5d